MFNQSLRYAAVAASSGTGAYFLSQPQRNKSADSSNSEPTDTVNVNLKLNQTANPNLTPVVPYASPHSYTHFQEIKKWDSNWDHRNVNKTAGQSDSDKTDSEFVDIKLPGKRGYRNIFLIRHGQYFTKQKEADEKKLTPLGHEQARHTGIRLAQMFNLEKEHLKRKFDAKNLNSTIADDSGTESSAADTQNSATPSESPFSFPKINLYQSSMIRAIETSEEIKKVFDEANVNWQLIGQSDLLCEGPPYPSEPPISKWCSEAAYYEESARIEAAFRKFIHRAEPEQDCESNDVIVCHANVIRYFVCRALQIPPEAWLRQSLAHGSITWIRVSPHGNVSLRCLGEGGFVPVEKVSRR